MADEQSLPPAPDSPAPPNQSRWALVGKILAVLFALLMVGGLYLGRQAYLFYAQIRRLAAVPAPEAGELRPISAEPPANSAATPPLASGLGSSLTPILSSSESGEAGSAREPVGIVAAPQVKDLLGLAAQLKQEDLAQRMAQRMAENPMFAALRKDPQFDAAFKEAMRPGGNPMRMLALLNDPKTKARLKALAGDPKFQKGMLEFLQTPELRRMMALFGAQSPALPPGAAGLAGIESRPIAPRLNEGESVDLQVMRSSGSSVSAGFSAPPPSPR